MSAGSVRRVSIGSGVSLPYPEPSSTAATTIGKANRRRNTKPELALRSCLHRAGMRYRVDLRVDGDGVRVRPDIVFTKVKVAVFVDGCFWHQCPNHRNVPAQNRDYWLPKLEANVRRDRRVDNALAGSGWHVERVWEHESPAVAAERVASIVNQRRRALNQARRS